MKQDNIESVIAQFTNKTNPEDRYTSFDYCYNYFKSTADLNKDMEKSCLALGFYLASWGMFRGSSFILQNSAKVFESTIQFISTQDKSVWEIDVDSYTVENINSILGIYDGIKKQLIKNENKDLTLITKILLGVFGFVPAFDNYFCNTFRNLYKGKCGFRRLNETSLGYIKSFYEANSELINKMAATHFTTDFISGQKTTIMYPKAKIIDMYGFIASS